MKITKRQLRRIIKEELTRVLVEDVRALVKKHASASVKIDDAIKAALADKPDVDPAALEAAMEDYYDEMMGF